MDSADLSLNEFFFPKGEMSQEEWAKADSNSTVDALRKKFPKDTRVKWTVASGTVSKKLSDILDIKLMNIIETGWKKYAELLKYTDREKYPPDSVLLVSLAEHTLKSEHKPSIEILVNGEVCGKIDFDVAVSLTLSGMILRVQDGRITGIISGTCKGEGTLKCEDTLIVKKSLDTITLPGIIDLGLGVPIGP